MEQYYSISNENEKSKRIKMKKILIAIVALTAISQAHWITTCDEDGNCKQIWIVEN